MKRTAPSKASSASSVDWTKSLWSCSRRISSALSRQSRASASRPISAQHLPRCCRAKSRRTPTSCLSMSSMTHSCPRKASLWRLAYWRAMASRSRLAVSSIGSSAASTSATAVCKVFTASWTVSGRRRSCSPSRPGARARSASVALSAASRRRASICSCHDDLSGAESRWNSRIWLSILPILSQGFVDAAYASMPSQARVGKAGPEQC